MPVLELFHISLRCQKCPKISFQEELFFPFKMSLGHEFVFNVDWNGKHGQSHSRWRNTERYFLWHWTRRGMERNEEWKTAILIHRVQTWSGHHIKVALGNFHIDWLRTWKKTTTIHNQVNEWTGMFAKLVFRNRFGPWPTAQLQHDLSSTLKRRERKKKLHIQMKITKLPNATTIPSQSGGSTGFSNVSTPLNPPVEILDHEGEDAKNSAPVQVPFVAESVGCAECGNCAVKLWEN